MVCNVNYFLNFPNQDRESHPSNLDEHNDRFGLVLGPFSNEKALIRTLTMLTLQSRKDLEYFREEGFLTEIDLQKIKIRRLYFQGKTNTILFNELGDRGYSQKVPVNS
jgi:hypothetical protein